MRKLLILLGILLSTLTAGVASASLYDYYAEQGLKLPPVSVRAILADSCNIENYVGLKSQNIALEACLRGDTMLGAIARPELFYSKNITRGLSLGGSETEIYVSALPNETTGYLIINPNSTDNRELIKYTGVTTTGGNQLTGVTRGLAEYGTTGVAISDSAVTANKKRHSSGEQIIMSNGRYEQNIIDVINGLQPTSANTFMIGDGLTSTDKILYLWDGTATSTAIKWDYTTNQLLFRRSGDTSFRVMPTQLRGTYADYASLPSSGNSVGDIAITTDDNKLYTWDGVSSWVLAGGSSGAGTVYKTNLLGSESDAGDLKTFTLTAGSWPSSNFLLVYKNGQSQREGATYDYTVTDSDTIEFTTTLASDDTVQMFVVSVDLYNPAWGLVNASIIPDTDNAYDLGTATKTFKDVYVTGTLYYKGVGATSTATANAIPVANGSGLLSTNWVGATTTAASSSIPLSNNTDATLSNTWIPALSSASATYSSSSIVNANYDVTYDCEFKPTIIQLNFSLKGINGQAGPVYGFSSGQSYWNGTTIKHTQYSQQEAITLATFGPAFSNSAPEAGDVGGGDANLIVTTLSVNSVTGTSVVVRANTTIKGSPSNAATQSFGIICYK